MKLKEFDFNRLKLQYKTGANPAAGANPADVVVPTSARWRFLTMFISLVCDATVVNRTLTVNLFDANSKQIWTKTFGNLTASQTGTMIIAIGNFTDDTTGTFQLISIPPELVAELGAGAKFTFSTTNLQAGDDYAATITTVKEAYA